jgi:Ran GTPase-activating protein 1
VNQIADFADMFTNRKEDEIPKALKAMLNALKDKTSVVELDLSDNAIGAQVVDSIVPFLTDSQSLQILKLQNNGLDEKCGEKIATALINSVQLKDGKMSNLRTVMCRRNKLRSGSAPVWARAFAAHKTLVDVRMPSNDIGVEGIKALADGLKHCPNLQHIDLQDNTFLADGDTSALEAWADVLQARKWLELRTLNLSDCYLSEEDAAEVPIVLTALAANSPPRLHTLQLQNNNLEGRTFKLLRESISTTFMSLKRLELQDNEEVEDDEHLEELVGILKLRGGKLFRTDEDEEEEEEEEEKADEAEEAVETNVPSVVDKAADDLADLLGKVTIR